MTTIRRAADGDLAAIVRMAVLFIGSSSYRGLITPDPERLADYASFLLAGAGVVFVAVDEQGEAFGMLAAQTFVHPLSGELTGTEAAWWVDPDRRGGRTARRLRLAAEAWARDQGAVRFQMIAPAGSAIGAWYRRDGYLEVETVFQRPLVAV